MARNRLTTQFQIYFTFPAFTVLSNALFVKSIFLSSKSAMKNWVIIFLSLSTPCLLCACIRNDLQFAVTFIADD